MREIDAADRKILRQLHLNARMTNVELGKEVGLSPSACQRRINLLETRGIIKGYTVILEGSIQPDHVSVFVQITLERQTEDYLNRFEAAVRTFPEIRECYLMTGGADYTLRVEADNLGDFERVHKEILSVLPGVLRIHSSLSIRNVLAHPASKRRQ